MQNIRLSAIAAVRLADTIKRLLADIPESEVKDVCIRAGDDIQEPLEEVEVHLTACAVVGSDE